MNQDKHGLVPPKFKQVIDRELCRRCKRCILSCGFDGLKFENGVIGVEPEGRVVISHRDRHFIAFRSIRNHVSILLYCAKNIGLEIGAAFLSAPQLARNGG